MKQKAQIVDRIPLDTGTPMSIRLSPDHKKIYVTTIDHNGIEVIDVATRKVINHFVLNTPTKQYRLFSGNAGSRGQAVLRRDQGNHQVSRALRSRQAEVHRDRSGAAEDRQDGGDPQRRRGPESGRLRRGRIEVSPDGKYLYQFGEKITILQASDFKVVDHIDLAQPDAPGMENVHFGGDLDLINEPGEHTAHVRLGPILSFTIACSVWLGSI